MLTFNVRYDEPRDGVNAWPLRKEYLIQTIRALDPDLIGLQEPDGNQGAFIAAALAEGWESRHGASLDARHPDAHGKAILLRRGRFEELARGRFWISATPDVPGSILQPNHWGQRTAVWARLKDRDGGREFFFACTHVDTHPGCHLASARILDRELKRVTGDTPSIVVGDFNAPAGGEAWAHLTGPAGYRDAWREAGRPDEGVMSYHAYGQEPAPPPGGNRRIDWILVRGPLRVEAAGMDTRSRDGRYPSDHHAVHARLEWA